MKISKHPAYSLWKTIKQRCYDRSRPAYSNYGGRGITICKAWLENPASFMVWTEKNGYKKGLCIDRIDNNKGYSPDNCRFVTRATNNNNRRNTIFLEHSNKTMALSEWAKHLKTPYMTLFSRYTRGWPTEKILSKRT